MHGTGAMDEEGIGEEMRPSFLQSELAGRVTAHLDSSINQPDHNMYVPFFFSLSLPLLVRPLSVPFGGSLMAVTELEFKWSLSVLGIGMQNPILIHVMEFRRWAAECRHLLRFH